MLKWQLALRKTTVVAWGRFKHRAWSELTQRTTKTASALNEFLSFKYNGSDRRSNSSSFPDACACLISFAPPSCDLLALCSAFPETISSPRTWNAAGDSSLAVPPLLVGTWDPGFPLQPYNTENPGLLRLKTHFPEL